MTQGWAGVPNGNESWRGPADKLAPSSGSSWKPTWLPPLGDGRPLQTGNLHALPASD